VLAGLAGPARVELAAGRHVLAPTLFAEETCANCEVAQTEVQASRGLLVSGRGLALVGAGAGKTVLETRAGYGVLFEDCQDCSLEGVTVEGGVRDADPHASDAAVVVKRSTVTVRGCEIADNLGAPAVVQRTVVGVMGVAVRDGSAATIEGCTIRRNSWDGIAVFRDSAATISGNVVDGVDTSTGTGGGRGAGIGITWNGRATIEGNLVRRYWKGIGVFVDGQAEIRRNVVEEVLAWGIAAWDAGRGRPRAVIEDNAVARTGACGIAVTVPADLAPEQAGWVRGNALVLTGRTERYDSPELYCRQVALDLASVPEGYDASDNAAYANREAGGAPGAGDLELEEFRRRTERLVAVLSAEPALADAGFLRDFGAP
jgi:parallel beta-helix repeat protein